MANGAIQAKVDDSVKKRRERRIIQLLSREAYTVVTREMRETPGRRRAEESAESISKISNDRLATVVTNYILGHPHTSSPVSAHPLPPGPTHCSFNKLGCRFLNFANRSLFVHRRFYVHSAFSQGWNRTQKMRELCPVVKGAQFRHLRDGSARSTLGIASTARDSPA